MKNISDIIHPHMHEHVGGGKDGPRANANPNDNGNDGNSMHGIGNNPGKSGTNPNDDGVNGFANQLQDVHGGIGIVNKQAADSEESVTQGLSDLHNDYDHLHCLPNTSCCSEDFY